MSTEIEGLHHVGHVVRNLEGAVEVYRRLGFSVEPPVYPLLPAAGTGAPRPFGAANTHVPFGGNFVELASFVDEDKPLPAGARTSVIQPPPEHLARITESIRRTSANLARCLARFEGLHILALQSASAEASATRLSARGVGHEGVASIQRPVETPQGPRLDTIRFLELAPVPEGRLAIAEKPAVSSAQEHPNGATALIEAMVCVPADERAAFVTRYEALLGCAGEPARFGVRYALGAGAVRLVTPRELSEALPGEVPPGLPAFVAMAISVKDLGALRRFLGERGTPAIEAAEGAVFVPASAALGAAVVFRAA